MSQSSSLHRHPLGTNELDKIIQSMSEQQALEQVRKLRIIYAKSKLQVEIPIHWTINKLKCMMSIHFQMLNFNKFEFQSNNFLIPGKTIVADLPNAQLVVTQADCPFAFENYYHQNMQKVLKRYNISTANSLYPITHSSVSNLIKKQIPKQRALNIEEVPQNRRRGLEDQPQGMLIIHFLRVIGIAFMVNLIFTFASYGQMAILGAIGLLYYLIDEYVKYNDRRRRQQEREAQIQGRRQENRRREQPNQPNLEQQEVNQQINRQQNKKQQIQNVINRQEQNQTLEQNQSGNNLLKQELIEQKQQIIQEKQKPERKVMKAKLTLWLVFAVQAIYCYILSIFPNWTVETHLHANQNKMNKIMDDVKRLDPETSQMVRKWQIKEDITEKLEESEQKIKNE